MIPRTLLHIWLNQQEESALAAYSVGTWARLGWPIEHVTLANVDRSDPVMAGLLASGVRSDLCRANDYLRVATLLQRGGWYLDGDVEVLRSFEDLESAGCCLAAETDDLVNCAVLGAQAGHWFLSETLAAMRARIDEKNPVAFSLRAATEVARRHGWTGNRDFQTGDLRILQSKAFYPFSWTEPQDIAKIGPESYTVHYWNKSWGDEPLVSIIIPCYQQAEYLAEAIQSALAQTWLRKEVIVVNDGSPDATSAVARRFPVKLIEQENRGLPAARNAGIAAATGKYILCLDADDRLAPECLKRCVGKGDIVVPGQQEFERGRAFYRRRMGRFSLRDFLVANRIHCASMFRRADWLRAGGFDEKMTLGFEDWEFWIRLVANGASVVAIDEPLFFYRVHKSMTATTSRPHSLEIKAYMRAKHSGLFHQCRLA